MTPTIRRATFKDIPHIAQIHERAFSENVEISQVEKCVQLGSRHTYIAQIGGKIAGYADCFNTTSITGATRRELDLLAIHPDYQKQGLGRRLIHHVKQTANDADIVRALVAVDNQPMQKAMSKVGFIQSPDDYALYIGQALSQTAIKPQKSHIINVETFTYSGLWLEGEITQQTIHATQQYLTNPHDIVGAVIPTRNKTTIQTLKAADFTHIKNFHWWHVAT